MSRALVIAAGAIIIPVVMALAVTNSDWFSGSSASAALLASDVRPGRPSVGTDASEAELGVAGGPLDCPPAGAGPEDSEQLFQRQGDKFWVTGTLSSFDGATAVVAGPSGDVSAKLASNFNLAGDLSPGSAVEMAGTVAGDGSMTASEIRAVCAGAGVIDCASGEDPRFQLRNEGCKRGSNGRAAARLKVRDGEAEAKRVAVLSRDGGDLTVQSPSGPLSVHVDDKTDIEGDLASAQEIHIQGRLQGNESILAEEIDVLCTKSQGENDQSG